MRIIVDGLPYPVVVTSSGDQEASAMVARAGGPAMLVADRNVQSTAATIESALRASNCSVLASALVDAGERRKSWRSVAALHDRLLAARADRDSLVVAVGGGTLTDVAGFAAATYMRGIRWLPVATTLVGMVDASIGGKTGVDMPYGKNLIGAIWPPIGVVADLAALENLRPALVRDGVAEIAKAAVVGDPSLLDALTTAGLELPAGAWAPIVARAAAVKARVVALDVRDGNGRAVLNLGHTFAHALEAASNYRLSHGSAVALGMRAAGILARDLTGWSREDHHRVLAALRRFGIRTRLANLSEETIVAAMQADKKRRNGSLRFVLPARLGDVRAGIEVPQDAVRKALRELSQAPRRGGF